jgi:biopolymer transport protein ExbD
MPLKTQQDQLPELNLTPMIDVLFLLIIFFMVGTKFAELERSVALQVPRVNQLGQLAPPSTRRVISIFRDGSLRMDDRQVTLDDLTQELSAQAQHSPQLSVVVRGDAEGPFQHVAAVLAACRQAGVRDLGISVQLDRTRR